MIIYLYYYCYFTVERERDGACLLREFAISNLYHFAKLLNNMAAKRIAKRTNFKNSTSIQKMRLDQLVMKTIVEQNINEKVNKLFILCLSDSSNIVNLIL